MQVQTICLSHLLISSIWSMDVINRKGTSAEGIVITNWKYNFPKKKKNKNHETLISSLFNAFLALGAELILFIQPRPTGN